MTAQRVFWIPRAAGILAILTAAVNAQFTPGPGSPIKVFVSNPSYVAAGNFGTGHMDLAIANWGDSTVTVLQGDGAGGFLPGAFPGLPGFPFPVGSLPYCVVVGDFNYDGQLDLAVANGGDNTVTILLGDGPGGFTPAAGSPFGVGSFPYSMAVGYFQTKSGNPIADLAIADQSSNQISMLYGYESPGYIGSGPLGPLNPPFPTGTDPVSVVAADFNLDGYPDLAVANAGGNSITVLLGNGEGGFTTGLIGHLGAPAYGLTGSPIRLAVGDFNGDGRPDLAVLIGNTVTVLLNVTTQSPFTFTPAPGSPITLAYNPSSIAVADFNGDGHLDLAITSENYNKVMVLLGDGTGNFTAAPGSPYATGTAPASLAAVDLNADGRPDLAIPNSTDNTLTVLLNSFPPAAPALVSPGNTTTGISLTPTLSWAGSTFATSYDVHFGTSSPPPLFTNTTGTAEGVGTLSGGTTYYWQIVAKDSAGSTASAIWSFTTVVTVPPAPVLISPKNGATGVSIAPTLSWNASSGATGYNIYLGTSASPPKVGTTATTAFAPGTLVAGTTYYWYVVATNGSGASSPSAMWSFTTEVSAPPAPVLTSPANGATGVSLSPNLFWNASSGATSYNIYLGTSASPPEVGRTATTSFAPGTLVAGTTYYWYVVATNSGGTSSPSATWSFTTQGTAPAVPVLISPANGATGVSITPTLSWNASSGATGYTIYLGTSTSPEVGTTTTTAFAPGTLVAGTTYYWYVVATNGSGAPSVSATWSFTTVTGTAGLHFVSVTPCRVADTRNANGTFGGPSMTAGQTRSFPIPQSACNIPATAQAYSLNVTVVPEGPLSYLTLWPSGESQPLVSTLNSFGGIVVANAAIVPAGIGAAVSVYVTNPTDVILDIDGYFDTSTGANSYSFYPVTPCRVADTRNPTGQFGGPSMYVDQSRDFPIPLSPCATPATARGYSLNVTVVPDAGYLGYLSTWPTGQARPLVSTLNSWTGKVVANAALVPAGSNESISVFVTDPTDVILDIDGYFAAPGSTGALSFYPVAPCRVADTRNANGGFGGPEMTAGETRAFTIPASSCNIPSTAAAYSLNVTVVPDGPLSYLTAWPTGSPRPFVSTLNSFDGSVVANAAIVPAGTAGAIDVYVTNPTQVILDINGYFAP